jgi:2-succinyl-6-hydroxy-2,4-cyclohexadiene-1-carboxylate synthase
MIGPITFHYQLVGHSGHTVLFLHGFLGDLRDWDEQVAALVSEHRCLTMDLPGHGRTTVAGPEELYDMPHAADALIALLGALDVRRCSLVGYSMGGRLALYLALTFPGCFDRLVLESASPGLRDEAERTIRRARDYELAQELCGGTLEDFLAGWYSRPLFASIRNNADRFEALVRKRLENHPLELSKSLRKMGLGNQPSLWGPWSKNRVPSLLIVGEQDAKLRSIASEMACESSSAQICVVPGCGHNVHYERPAAYTELVRNFLGFGV